ncbi:MAG: hypothetical protein J3Q66DRAFT_425289 [Benniella sp.]|nr:MAG: hypothetical protein J3Q66DRAFT_425289 [Benniella sp.]
MAPKNPSPLDIPEVLTLIFAHLGLHSIRIHASLVCRLWYKVATPILRARPLIWYRSPRHKNPPAVLSKRLQETKTLIIKKPNYFGTHYDVPMLWDSMPSWIELTNHLNTLSKDRQLQITEVTVLQRLASDDLVFQLITPLGPQLTRLRLSNINQSRDMPLEKILVLCPRLTRLHMHYLHGAYYHDNYRNQLDPSQRPTLPTSLELRSLTLENIGIEERSLLRLLNACWDLEELRLIRLLQGWPMVPDLVPEGATNESLVSFSKQPFMEQIAQICPFLKSIHFSGGMDPSWNLRRMETTSQIFRLFPNVTAWSFQSSGGDSMLLKSLRTCYQNTLTSIEMLHTSVWRDRTGDLLHQYLCEAPQLLHLRAIDVMFRTYWFDLEGILDAKGMYHGKNFPRSAESVLTKVIGSSIEPYHRKIWACRNLQTLHLRFDARDGDYVNGERARVLFGYLSRVCPKLEELAICQPRLRLDLDGGFCLLSRLHELRRLSFSINADCRKHITGVDWMARCMSPLQRWMIAMRMKMIYFLKERKKTIYAKTPFSSTDAPPPPYIKIWERRYNRIYVRKPETDRSDDIQASPERHNSDGKSERVQDPDYLIDGVDMRDVGRWKDIVDLFENRLSKDWICWPLLESFKIEVVGKGQEQLDKVKPAIRHIRGDIEVQ